jgi:hypothetical protein
MDASGVALVLIGPGSVDQVYVFSISLHNCFIFQELRM